MKYKVQNNTQVKLWIGDFCFVPGTSTVEIGTSQKKGVDAILKNNKSIDWHDLYEMKDAFEVSISALTTRLKQLKLIYIDEKNKKIYSSEEAAKGFISMF